MEEISAYITIVVLCVMASIALYHEIKCMKTNRIKAEEEISLIRHCIYLMEQNSSCFMDENENA